MSTGVIGLGRLGSALVRGLCMARRKDVIYGYNRTPGKEFALKEQCVDFQICNSDTEVLELCDTVFLWTKPPDAVAVMEKKKNLIRKQQTLLISCMINVPLADYTPRWAECLPNVNMPIGRGVTVISYAPTLPEADKIHIKSVLNQVGTVYEVPSGELTYYSALCSCGPALYATMFEMFADIFAAQRGYDRETCRRMVRETALGTLLLQEKDGIDTDELVYRVAHPGGSSEAGINYLKPNLPAVYENMLKAMKKW
jgi:pyrroline-5-carboxylate reductase